MKINRGLALFSAATLLITLLSACSSGEGSTDTTADTAAAVESDVSLEGYVIMRGDSATDGEIDAAVLLRNALDGITLTTDWVKRGESVPETGREILVGSTNRPESIAAAADLRYYDEYKIETVGERIVIIGATPEATLKAAEHFIESREDYVYRHEFEYAAPTLNGVSIEEYVIKTPAEDKYAAHDQALALAKLLHESCGARLEVLRSDEKSDSAYELRIGYGNEPKADSYFCGFDADGKTYIINGGSRLGLARALGIFRDMFYTENPLALEAGSVSEGSIWD